MVFAMLSFRRQFLREVDKVDKALFDCLQRLSERRMVRPSAYPYLSVFLGERRWQVMHVDVEEHGSQH